MDWIDLAEERDNQWAFVNVVKLWVPKNAGNLTSYELVSFSRRTLLHGVISK